MIYVGAFINSNDNRTLPIDSAVSDKRGIPHEHIAIQVEISSHLRRLDVCVLNRSIKVHVRVALVVNADCHIEQLLSLVFRKSTFQFDPPRISPTGHWCSKNGAFGCPLQKPVAVPVPSIHSKSGA